ncbi:hypothetical protein Taro_051015, partial [Colocasia esculenta]|nr:hypothetical protein [Colocasia esculenta]
RRSEVNRKNKGVQKIFHCAGTQTFADIRKAELQKSGQDMDRSKLFIVTHTRKDGIPVNSECAVAILTSKRVKMLDMYGSQLAIGIVMSTDPTKIVMGRPIGQDFCEVVVLLANKSDSPIFIKDHNRKAMKDVIGSHILWFLEYVQLDFKSQVSDHD